VESYYRDRPLNFGHRGASYEAPENTLAAFVRAIELGADGIELDVQLSKDGQLVAIHDATLEATTDGQGRVQNRTLAELKELDAGSWFAPAFAGQHIPTLQEVIDVVGNRLLLNIELKTRELNGDGLAAAVVTTVKENNLLDRAIVSSFNPLAVWRSRRLEPGLSVGMLYSPDQPLPFRRLWLRRLIRPSALHPHHAALDEATMEWARKRGYRVHAWTVDDPAEMRRLKRIGVDVIITNRPDRLRRVLQGG
jgi:glycerophosphoryl diester phosphodiesterase